MLCDNEVMNEDSTRSYQEILPVFTLTDIWLSLLIAYFLISSYQPSSWQGV